MEHYAAVLRLRIHFILMWIRGSTSGKSRPVPDPDPTLNHNIFCKRNVTQLFFKSLFYMCIEQKSEFLQINMIIL